MHKNDSLLLQGLQFRFVVVENELVIASLPF